MFFPTNGCIMAPRSATSSMVEPHKVGRVMWSKTSGGYMAPVDLHPQLTRTDEDNLDRVFSQMSFFRKVAPVLETIQKLDWVNMALIKPWLMASMDGRVSARKMMVDESWGDFWSSIE